MPSRFILITILVAALIVLALIMGAFKYFFDKPRNKQLEKLADDFGLSYKGSSSIWSFIPFLRMLFWQLGTIQRHQISGKLGNAEVLIYDSSNYVQTDAAAIFLHYTKEINRTIIKANDKFMDELMLPQGFMPVDKLKEALGKIKNS